MISPYTTFDNSSFIFRNPLRNGDGFVKLTGFTPKSR